MPRPSSIMKRVALMFRKPVFFSDTILALRAGPLIHVEILPIDDNNPENTLSYTSFVGSPFSMSISTKRTYENDTCVGLAFDVSEHEHELLVSYLHDLCEKNIPYNYSDVALSVLPSGIKNSFVDDVASESPTDITSLFCSQAVVLALRNALDEKTALFQRLKDVNSRTVLPYALYHVIKPYARSIDCVSLQHGVVSYSVAKTSI